MPTRRAIAIVGGGFCGAATAIHLLRGARQPLDISLFEPRPVLGAGLAYSTGEPHHRINGPIDILAIFADDIGHFPRWFEASGEAAADSGALAATGQIYCRRAAFGRYMDETLRLHAAATSAGFRHVRAAVDDLHAEADGYRLVADGAAHRADMVLLCLGHERPGIPRELRSIERHQAFLADPWDMTALGAVPSDGDVALIGTGLTAVDVAASLLGRGHTGRILALSRRGLLPRPQGKLPPVAQRLEKLFRSTPVFIERHGRPATVRQLLAAVRADIATARRAGGGWQDAFDDLRDAAPQLWPKLDITEQRRALRHLRTWYDVHRFRMAPQLWHILTQAEASGRFQSLRARVTAADATASGKIALAMAGKKGDGPLLVDAVINCTGPSADPARSGNPFLARLVERGTVSAHPTGVGLAVDAECRALTPQGQPCDTLRVLGVLSRGEVGDLIAVPQINGQIRRVLSSAGLTG